jgi:hypothetical protein
MPKPKGYVVNIPRLYKWQSLDMMIFGYVQGLLYAIPTLTVTKAIKIFLENFNLTEDTYSFDYAYAGYFRVLASIVEIREGFVDDVENIIL